MQSSFVQLESNSSAHQPLISLRLHSSLFLSGFLGSPRQERTRGSFSEQRPSGAPSGLTLHLSPAHRPQPFLLVAHAFSVKPVSSLCQSVSSCSCVGARVNVPKGHRLLLPCCFLTVSTQTLRLSAHLCICLDSSQQVCNLRKSDGCAQAITRSAQV